MTTRTVTLSTRDIAALAATAMTEVGHWAGRDQAQFRAGVASVVDTILNRSVSPGYPAAIGAIVNAPDQFTGVTNRGGWENVRTSQAVYDAVVAHLAARESGQPSTVGGSTHFLNPDQTTTRSGRSSPPPSWARNIIDNPDLVVGQEGDWHFHGTPTGNRPAGAIGVRLADEARRGLVESQYDLPGMAQESVNAIAGYVQPSGQRIAGYVAGQIGDAFVRDGPKASVPLTPDQQVAALTPPGAVPFSIPGVTAHNGSYYGAGQIPVMPGSIPPGSTVLGPDEFQWSWSPAWNPPGPPAAPLDAAPPSLAPSVLPSQPPPAPSGALVDPQHTRGLSSVWQDNLAPYAGDDADFVRDAGQYGLPSSGPNPFSPQFSPVQPSWETVNPFAVPAHLQSTPPPAPGEFSRPIGPPPDTYTTFSGDRAARGQPTSIDPREAERSLYDPAPQQSIFTTTPNMGLVSTPPPAPSPFASTPPPAPPEQQATWLESTPPPAPPAGIISQPPPAPTPEQAWQQDGTPAGLALNPSRFEASPFAPLALPSNPPPAPSVVPGPEGSGFAVIQNVTPRATPAAVQAPQEVEVGEPQGKQQGAQALPSDLSNFMPTGSNFAPIASNVMANADHLTGVPSIANPAQFATSPSMTTIPTAPQSPPVPPASSFSLTAPISENTPGFDQLQAPAATTQFDADRAPAAWAIPASTAPIAAVGGVTPGNEPPTATPTVAPPESPIQPPSVTLDPGRMTTAEPSSRGGPTQLGPTVSPAGRTGGPYQSGQTLAPLGPTTAIGQSPAAEAFMPGIFVAGTNPDSAWVQAGLNAGMGQAPAGQMFHYSPFSATPVLGPYMAPNTGGWDPTIPMSGPGIFGAFNSQGFGSLNDPWNGLFGGPTWATPAGQTAWSYAGEPSFSDTNGLY